MGLISKASQVQWKAGESGLLSRGLKYKKEKSADAEKREADSSIVPKSFSAVWELVNQWLETLPGKKEILFLIIPLRKIFKDGCVLGDFKEAYRLAKTRLTTMVTNEGLLIEIDKEKILLVLSYHPHYNEAIILHQVVQNLSDLCAEAKNIKGHLNSFIKITDKETNIELVLKELIPG